MGAPQRDNTEEIVAKNAQSVSVQEFIAATEGNRPPVEDPRKSEKTKIELSEEELKKQEQATKTWEEGLK